MHRFLLGPRRSRIAAAILLASAGLVPSAAALALDCPAPQPLAKPGILKETPARAAEVGKLLTSGDTYNAIAAVTADLRARYPGVERAELVNYLLSAYCPAIAANARLSELQKREAVQAFSNEVMYQVY